MIPLKKLIQKNSSYPNDVMKPLLLTEKKHQTKAEKYNKPNRRFSFIFYLVAHKFS
jgi:hypothetical protein